MKPGKHLTKWKTVMGKRRKLNNNGGPYSKKQS